MLDELKEGSLKEESLETKKDSLKDEEESSKDIKEVQ